MSFEYVLEGCYGPEYGWEDMHSYPCDKEGQETALNDLKAYRDNQPEYQFRLKTRKV